MKGWPTMTTRAPARNAATKSEATKVTKETTTDEAAPEELDLDQIADLTKQQLASMEDHLDGKASAPVGPNLAVMGFFAKSNDSQLIGVVRAYAEQPNRLDRKNTDHVLFVEGIADYPKDVLNNDGE